MRPGYPKRSLNHRCAEKSWRRGPEPIESAAADIGTTAALAPIAAQIFPKVRRVIKTASLCLAWRTLKLALVDTTLTFGEIHGRLDRVRIDRVVPPSVTAVGRSTPLVDAIRLMRARRLAALPVAQGDRLVGLLTEDDLLEVLAALLDEDPPPDRARGGD